MGGLPFPGYEDDLVYRGDGDPMSAMEPLPYTGEGDPMAQMRDLVLRYGNGEGFGDKPMPIGGEGGLPTPSLLSPDTRKIILDQIQKLNAPRKVESSMWTDPAFLAGMTLLGGGKMSHAAQVAAQAQARAEQMREMGDAHRATALSSLTGRLTEADKATAMAAKGKRDAMGKALTMVAPTQRGRFGRLIQESGVDPTDPLALQAIIEQNGLPLAPNLKVVPGVGLVEMGSEKPTVVIPVQRQPHAPPAAVAEYEYAKSQGFKGTLLEFEKAKKAAGEGSGPFAGNAIDAQTMNLLRNGDPMSPEYEMAYLHLYGPKQVQQGDGTTVVMQPPIPQGIPKPGTPRQAAASSVQGAPAPSPQSDVPPAAAPTTTQLPGGGSVTRVGEAKITPAEKTKMTTAITEAATLSNALDDYVKAFEDAGAGERISSVAGINTPMNTAYSNTALLAKGEQLYNLGVLNGPDLTILQKTLADPSTFKGQAAGPEAARAAAESVRRLIQDRINAARQQLGLPALDIQQYGKSLRPAAPGASGDPAKEGRFSGMNRGDLAKIDPKTLKPEEAAQWRAAAKRMLGE